MQQEYQLLRPQSKEPLGKRCKWLCSLFLLLSACLQLTAQESPGDSLDIRYQLVETHYLTMEDVFKIKVPPYLSTQEVKDQIRLAVQWPGDPPPRKITTVYVFQDGQKRGATSKTGGIYVPGKGFRWDLDDWEPNDSILDFEPGDHDKLLYNMLLDSLFAKGLSSAILESEEELPIRKSLARDFEISEADVDSIYFHVKWWIELQKRHRESNFD